MTKNQKTYLLLIAVVVVWGSVGVRIFNQIESDAPVIIRSNAKFIPKGQKEKIDYTILPNYRDPFLGKLYVKPKPKVRKKTVVNKPLVVFPNIQYNGVINGDTKTFIITIDGGQRLFEVGDVIKGVELVKGNNKEVTLRYQKKTKKYSILQ